jgi:hypothetical protein
MTYWIASALPVLRGQTERVRTFGAEIEPHLEEFERLNREVLRAARPRLRATFPLGTREVLDALRRGEDPGANGIVVL